MQRRLVLAAATTAATLTLGACGFKLREAPEFAFSTLYLAAGESSPLGNELRRNLESTGKVKVFRDGKSINDVDVILDLQQEQRERVVVGLNANGEVREVQIRSRFKFRVRSHDEQELVPETELLREMDVSYAEAQALAKDAEIDMLFRSMEQDAVQQIMLRLAMIKAVAPLPGAKSATAADAATAPASGASGSGW